MTLAQGRMTLRGRQDAREVRGGGARKDALSVDVLEEVEVDGVTCAMEERGSGTPFMPRALSLRPPGTAQLVNVHNDTRDV